MYKYMYRLSRIWPWLLVPYYFCFHSFTTCRVENKTTFTGYAIYMPGFVIFCIWCSRMKYHGVYEFTEDKIGGAFGKYGGFIARHAWKVLFLSVIVNGFLGLGMVKLRSDIKAQQVYLQQGKWLHRLRCYFHVLIL